MTDADRARLVAILGMLGSNHAGERAAAALQAEAFRRKHGLTWADMVNGKTVYVSPPPPPPPQPQPQPWTPPPTQREEWQPPSPITWPEVYGWGGAICWCIGVAGLIILLIRAGGPGLWAPF